MREEKTVVQYHDPTLINLMQQLIDGDIPNDQDGIIHTFSATFGDGIEIDVKIVGVPDDDAIPHVPTNLFGNSYVDAVLFRDGEQVDQWSYHDEIESEFHFYYNDTDYTLILKQFQP